MNHPSTKEIRRVRILQYVLFGVFTLFYCAVLKGDALVAFVFQLCDERWLPSPWILGVGITFIILFVVAMTVRYKTLLPARTPLTVRLLLTAIVFFVIGMLSNSNEIETLELRMSRLCVMGKYEEALKEGERFVHSSPNLLSLRAYALTQLQTSKQIPLAERLLNNPLPPNATSKDLKIDSTTHTIAPFYNKLIELQQALPVSQQQEQALHLRLMGTLLDGNLDSFVHHLPKTYFSSKPEYIPTTYREALYLYARLTSQPIVTIQDATTAANYRDFLDYQQKVISKYPSYHKGAKDAERNQMRNMYGGTYWFYYFYEINQSR